MTCSPTGFQFFFFPSNINNCTCTSHPTCVVRHVVVYLFVWTIHVLYVLWLYICLFEPYMCCTSCGCISVCLNHTYVVRLVVVYLFVWTIHMLYVLWLYICLFEPYMCCTSCGCISVCLNHTCVVRLVVVYLFVWTIHVLYVLWLYICLFEPYMCCTSCGCISVCLNHTCVVRLVVVYLFVCHPDRYACRHWYTLTTHRPTQSKVGREVNARLYINFGVRRGIRTYS